jgi:ABC-type transport system involved in cytochrome bd biosynthesis fused ATPase/permease subunit
MYVQDGLIVERGNHAYLLEQGGVYSSMWQQQQESLDTGGLDIDHTALSQEAKL